MELAPPKSVISYSPDITESWSLNSLIKAFNLVVVLPSVKSPLKVGVVVDTALTVPVQVVPDAPASILNTPLGVEYSS